MDIARLIRTGFFTYFKISTACLITRLGKVDSEYVVLKYLCSSNIAHICFVAIPCVGWWKFER